MAKVYLANLNGETRCVKTSLDSAKRFVEKREGAGPRDGWQERNSHGVSWVGAFKFAINGVGHLNLWSIEEFEAED